MNDKDIEQLKTNADVVFNISESNATKVYESVKSDLNNTFENLLN